MLAGINRGHALSALARVLRWRIQSRLADGDVTVPFVDGTVLVGRPGMTGMTLNVYCGLTETNEMGFALHLLRDDSLFVDVGANVGVYTVLASGVCGARSIACEPIEKARSDLRSNVAANRIGDRVEIHQCAVGATVGTVHMLDDRDTMNRVVTDGDYDSGVEVPVTTLDHLLKDREPTLIKIDVEGFEEQVLAGADKALQSKSLLAVTLEAGPFAADGGERRRTLCATMAQYGFKAASYDPLNRILVPMDNADCRGDDIIFVRDLERIGSDLKEAPRRQVLNTSI
jgi:FkbM family methyltransferase